MEGAFPQSKELKGIIEGYNWTLLDVSNPPEGRTYRWNELEKKSPAEEYKIGHMYMFVPTKEEGQTWAEVYGVTEGLGPTFIIDDLDDEAFLSLEVYPKKMTDDIVALFTRLIFSENFAVLTAAQIPDLPNPDFVAIGYDKLVDTFKKYFTITFPEDYEPFQDRSNL